VEGAVVQEVLFYILDDIFHFALAFGIRFPAEVQGKRLLPCIRPEGIGKDNVPAVLADNKYFVLVINNLPGDAPYIGEGLFMGINGQPGSEVSVGEPDIFEAGT